MVSSKVTTSLSLVPWGKVDPGYLAAAVADLSSISNLWGEGENQALCRGGRSASEIGSLRVGDDGSGGDGILGRGDDKGDSDDGGGDGGAGAASHTFMWVLLRRPRPPRRARSSLMVRRDLLWLVCRWPELGAPPPSPPWRGTPRDHPRDQPFKGHPQSARGLLSNQVIEEWVIQVPTMPEPLLAQCRRQLVERT
ncbi:hypothetical protein Tco_1174924 [Tanacetum coccineum]